MNLIEKAKEIVNLNLHRRIGCTYDLAQAIIEAEEIVRKLKHDVHAQRTVLDIKKPYKSEDEAQAWLEKYESE